MLAWRTAVQILQIPSSALLLLIGPSGSGKSTFARAHFQPTEILSSDYFRSVVSDDESNQKATADAFEVLHLVLEKRLQRGKLCVVDATNVRAADRSGLLAQARKFRRPAVALVLETPESLAVARAGTRADRIVEAEIVKRQMADLSRSLDTLEREGFAKVFKLNPADQVEIRRIDC